MGATTCAHAAHNKYAFGAESVACSVLSTQVAEANALVQTHAARCDKAENQLSILHTALEKGVT
jgi:hypothetical protein